jgi:uncharacterized protein YggU (UPF0235/DUF167 family)
MVRATPRSGRDAIDGIVATGIGRTALKARVRAAPAGGEANEALARLLARTADVPRSAVVLLQGAAARLKTFRIAGDAAKLAATFEQALETNKR